MPETTLADVQHSLDRAIDLETEAAVDELRTARQNLAALEGEPAVDEARRRELATTLEQRIREVRNRDAYDSELGAAMNPEEEDAP
ncbi:hypothetical protein [Natronorubrum thiooxidans]|uniref:Uncharacterized protein n=1 Tax=Natronorubrum thiooxidans TaxID=308853 RepID=A0A1N7FC35_9EURY|nr:hypothetical protein [Natronorubrum thiooxidans]SIR97842.1 hypothetical protein SAMN05421752_106180 [Natronorubrum thiooxidans]